MKTSKAAGTLTAGDAGQPCVRQDTTGPERSLSCMHTGCARYASSRGECPQNPGQCSVVVSSCLASSSNQVNLLDFTYHSLSPAVINGNYRHLESQFLQDSPSVVLTQTPSYRLAAEAKCYKRGTREFATGHYPAATPLPAGARRRHAIWRERKGAAERARGRASEWRRFGTTAAAREEKINRTRAAGGVSQGLACRPAGGIGRCTVDGALQ